GLRQLRVRNVRSPSGQRAPRVRREVVRLAHHASSTVERHPRLGASNGGLGVGAAVPPRWAYGCGASSMASSILKPHSSAGHLMAEVERKCAHPGLCLTPAQGSRLRALDRHTSEEILKRLVVAGFLACTRRGTY